jgi:hypothetical protein
MAQMVEQQQRTSAVIELLAARPVQVPAVEGGVPAPPPIEVRPPSPAPPEHNVPEPPVDLVVAPRTPERAPDRRPSQKPRIGVASHLQWPPAQRKLQNDVQLLQVWTRRTQPNSWKSMSGTPRTPKYPLKRSCRKQTDISAKQRLDGRSSTRVNGNALQNFAPNF